MDDIMIFGVPWAVECSTIDDPEGALRLCIQKEARFVIDEEMPEIRQKQILFHEVLHAVDFESAAGKDSLTESQVVRIAAMVFGILRTNPHLVEYFFLDD